MAMIDQPQDQQKEVELRSEASPRKHLAQVPLNWSCFQVFFPLPEMKLGSFQVPVAVTKSTCYSYTGNNNKGPDFVS
jgi:hypothetical protein